MTKHYALPDGTLTLDTQGDVAADELFSMAARDNPNRAFLFVSKVLGKHLPVSPVAMASVHSRLAQQLQTQLVDAPEPLLFIGMAETATALANGVYDQWLNSQPMQSSLYIATSRYCLADHERIEFAEAHSHAPAIGLHIPNDVRLRQRFMQAQTLVLIDDELSTGNTFVNLIHTLQAKGLPIKRVIMVTLTDFSTTHADAVAEALAPLHISRVSLLQGQWQYHAERMPEVSSDWQTQGAQRVILPVGDDIAARSATDTPLQFSEQVRNSCKTLLSHSNRLLVLGCGEFMYAPYRLAALASELGADVYFCATTRSPIREWGIITQRQEWPDPYGEGVRNFLYNYQREDYDDVWLVSELPPNDILRHTARTLDARLLHLPSPEKLTTDVACSIENKRTQSK